MKVRAITGFFFVGIMVASLLLGKWVFASFFSLLGLASQYEFYGLVLKDAKKKDLFPWILYGLSISLAFSLYFLKIIEAQAILLFLGVGVFLFIVELFKKNASRPFETLAFGFLGILYLVVPFMSFTGLGFLSGHYRYEIPLGFLLLLWSNDTGAYLAGRSFGKRKLFERISPNKTWEGFIGGLLLAVGVALNLEQYLGSMTKTEWAIMAFIISTIGTLGDLVESMLKRSLNVKDSGNILPGHGGLLDRFDGLLLSAPVVFIYLTFIS